MKHPAIVNNYGIIFLRVFFIVMLVRVWILVFNPRVKVFHGSRRGGSRVPKSLKSKLASALCITACCLALFRIRPLFCAAAATLCVAAELLVTKWQDVREYERQTLRLEYKPTNNEQEQDAVLVLDAVFLVLFLFFVIRNHFRSPVTEEQRILHYMGWGCLAFTSIVALVLLWGRTRRGTPKQ
jgi:Ca2+/Na+ antiporter